MNNYKSIQDFLDTYHRKHVNFTFTDTGTIILAKNLIKSAELVNTPVVFFGLDKQSLECMQGLCDTVDATELGYNTGAETNNFNPEEFIRLCYAKYVIYKYIVSSGRSAVYTDTDVVFRKEFETDLLHFVNRNQHSMIFQSAHKSGRPCAGFSAMSSRYNISKIDTIINGENTEYHDQQFILKHLISDVGLNLNIKLLTRDHYPNGHWFYKNSDRLADISKIIHFNCIGGKDKNKMSLDEQIQEKIDTMKRYDCWFL